MSFLEGVFGNVVANVVFWLLLGLAVWLASRVEQVRFARFFGLSGNGRIVVVLSNLWEPASSNRTVGYWISMHESLAANSIRSLVSTAPMRMPELVRGLVDALWLGTRIRCNIEVSQPAGTSTDEPVGSLVVVGATSRNSLRHKYLTQGVPRAVMAHEMPEGATLRRDEVREITVTRSGGDKQVVRSQLNLAVVEKAVLADQGRVVFFCLSSRGDLTQAATDYLVRNWRRFGREFGERPFVVCLGYPISADYLSEYSDPVVLAQFMP